MKHWDFVKPLMIVKIVLAMAAGAVALFGDFWNNDSFWVTTGVFGLMAAAEALLLQKKWSTRLHTMVICTDINALQLLPLSAFGFFFSHIKEGTLYDGIFYGACLILTLIDMWGANKLRCNGIIRGWLMVALMVKYSLAIGITWCWVKALTNGADATNVFRAAAITSYFLTISTGWCVVYRSKHLMSAYMAMMMFNMLAIAASMFGAYYFANVNINADFRNLCLIFIFVAGVLITLDLWAGRKDAWIFNKY